MTPIRPAQPDLAHILGAESRPPTVVMLPRTNREVSIATYLRREIRAEWPIERVPSCWAPNKPAIVVDGRATWAEFAIVRALERSGWEARWIKNWTGGREFCIDVGRPSSLPATAADAFDRIHREAPALRGAGSWDVIVWRGSEYLFLESKQHRSSDRLNPNQRAWPEAALAVGMDAPSLAIVEYDAGPPKAPRPRASRDVVATSLARVDHGGR